MELTEVKFWDDYWAKTKLPCTVDLDFSYDRCLAHALKINLPDITGEVLEVGCAPWLLWLMSSDLSQAALNIQRQE